MTASVNHWIELLRRTDALAGIPLIVAGVGLMFFGWRLWKPCVVIFYALIGVGVAAMIPGLEDGRMLLVPVLGILFGLASYWPAKYALSLLGGLIGMYVVVNMLTDLGMDGMGLWFAGAAALFGFAGMAHINRDIVVIALTAFLGSALLLSGLMSFITESRVLYGHVRSVLLQDPFTMGFVILVPTVVGFFLQCGDARQMHGAK